MGVFLLLVFLLPTLSYGMQPQPIQYEQLNHFRTLWEQTTGGALSSDKPRCLGEVKRFISMTNIPVGIGGRGLIDHAIDEIASSSVGADLLVTFATKQLLKLETLNRIKNMFQAQTSAAAIAAIFNVQNVNGSHDIGNALGHLIWNSGWEEKCVALLNMNQVAQVVAMHAQNQNNAATILRIDQCIQSLAVNISNEVHPLRHCFANSADPFVSHKIIIDCQHYGVPEPVSCLQLLKPFDPQGVYALVQDTDNLLIAQRDITLAEIIFHELNHGLHFIENRQYYPIALTMEMLQNWHDNEEYRNLSGLIFLNPILPAAYPPPQVLRIQVDSICTFNFDLQRGVNPRFPWATIAPGNFPLIWLSPIIAGHHLQLRKITTVL